MRSLIFAATALALMACEATAPAPSPTTQTPVVSLRSPTPIPVTTRAIAFANGLVLDLPLSWQSAPDSSVNRGTYRWVFAGNGDVASVRTVPGNGDVDLAALADDRVLVEVESFCRLMCSGPTSESALPLDWSNALPLAPVSSPLGKHELALGFRWFDEPIFLVARWGDAAPAADLAAIERIARSVRPETTPPATGEFRGWDGVGPLANFPIGSVTLRPLPSGATLRPGAQTYDTVPYYVVRGRLNAYAFSSQPLMDKRCTVAYDTTIDQFWCQVGDRRFAWTRFGRFLGPEPASDLVQHRVIVRDGSVWVRYVESTLSSPPVQDETAER